MADLRVQLAGLELVSPLVLASGPLSWNGDAIVRAHQAGAAAVVTKTISHGAARSTPWHVSATCDAVLNCERWSDLPASRWIDRELPRAKGGGATVIASLGLSARDVVALARGIEGAGADAIEVVSYDETALPAMVRAAARRVHVPVFAKLSANGRDLVGTARRCMAGGASAITAIDSLGPALRIELERRRPRLGADAGWLSGQAILPIALHSVRAVREAVAVPIVGTGGVIDAETAIEMLFAGATAVGLCSAPLVHGLDLLGQIRHGMAVRLDELGFPSACAATGALRAAVDEAVVFRFGAAACTTCGACVRVCPYHARKAPDAVDAACRACGLCVSVCPTGALRAGRSEG